MFDISLGELVLLVAVAVLFLKPEDVPGVLRLIGKAVRWVKRTSREIVSLFDSVIDEPKTTMIKGDDGKYYQAYDVGEVMEKKNDSTP